MKLSKAAILAIRGSKSIKRQLMEAFEVSEPTVFRWLAANDDNLTKAAALKIIREETGLTDKQILTEQPETIK
jgi:hypothetical protein